MPLAIELANIYLRKSGKSLSEFGNLLSTRSYDFLNFEARLSDTAYNNPAKRSIFELLETNLRDLGTEKVGTFLSLIGFFDTSLINLSFISSAVLASDVPPIDTGGVEIRLGSWREFFSSPDFDLVVGTLVELSFARRTTQNDCKVLVVHPLVHEWARHRLNRNESSQYCIDAAAILSLALRGSDTYTLAARPELSCHVHFLLTKLRELGFQSISADIGIDALSFIILQFAHTLQREKLHSDACQLYEDLLEETALKSKEPAKSTLLLQAIENYGRLLWQMGELEKAEEQLVYVRKVKLQNFGDDDPRFLEADKELSGLQGRLNNIRANLSRAIVSSQGPKRPPQMGDPVIDEDVMDDEWQLIQLAEETRELLGENSLEYSDAVVNLADYYIKTSGFMKLPIWLAECVRLFSEVHKGKPLGHWKWRMDNLLLEFAASDLSVLRQPWLNNTSWKEKIIPPLMWMLNFINSPSRFLQLAIDHGGVDFVQILLSSEEDKKMFPLACCLGPDVLQPYLVSDQNLEALISHERRPLTPLMVAAIAGNDATVQLLLDRGANINTRCPDGNTALLMSVRYNNHSTAHLLCERGADINARDRYGNTALHCAASTGQKSIVQLLLDLGVDIESPNANESTALMAAATNGNEAIVNLLRERGADINARTKAGNTVLHGAASTGQRSTVQLLLDLGVDVNCRGQYEATALITAAANGNDSIVHVLLDRGADIDTQNSSGFTALFSAAENGEDSTVQLLLDRGAKIDIKNKYGLTPLLLAAGKGKNSTVQLLLERGADMNARTNDTKTALDLARSADHEPTVQLLLRRQ